MNRKSNLLALLGAGLITVLVVASYSAASSSAAPTNQAAPTISGTPQEGTTLTASSGTWNGTTPITYHYQWRRCDKNGVGCANIGGADTSTYLVKHADVGKTLRVRVTARNADGSAQATSAQTSVVTAKPAAPTPSATGCPSGSGPVNVSDVTSPAHLLIDGQQVSPGVITRSSGDITVRFHVSACSGRSVAGALVYATAIPYNQFSIPPETATDSSGWATMTMHQAGAFPASPRQQLLAVFVRARKPGEPLLAGIAARRLVSFPVHV